MGRFLSLSIRIQVLFLVFTLSLNAQEVQYAVANQSVINMRSEPSFSAEMCSQALLGMPLRVVEKHGGWHKVMTPEGYSGWVNSSATISMSADEYKRWMQSPKLIITNYYTILRKEHSEKSEVVSDLVWGNILQFKAKKGKYFEVGLPDGRTGFVLRSQAERYDEWVARLNPTPERIVATAMKFVGFPYLWGGTSIKGIDCSGLTKTSYYLNGIILRRNASEQAQTGENIDIKNGFSNLNVADLLFFGSLVDGKEKVTHVGMYMGEGKFIHSSGMVRINSLLPDDLLYDEYNTKRLLRAQRILTRIDVDSGIVSIAKHPFYCNLAK